MRLLYFLACLHGTLATLIPAQGRGLGDVFGGLDAPGTPSMEPPEGHSVQHVVPPSLTHATAGVSSTQAVTLGGILTGIVQANNTSSTNSATHSQTSSGSSPTSYSVIGSIPPLPSYTPYSNKSSSSSPTSSTAYPTMTNRSQAAESSSRSTQSWKIVGVAVIAFTVVAAVLLLSVFFDQWWSFMKDFFWKKRRKDRFEEFVPDWEQASWEIKMDKDGANRYPSFAGPPRRTRTRDIWQEKYDWTVGENVAGVGSGTKPNVKQEPTLPQCPPNPAWSLGFVTPVPPPPALHNSFRAEETSPFDRRKSRITSTAFSEVNPYAGIE